MDRDRATWGVILVLIGVILLGERLDWGVRWNMGRLWPLLLIGIGLVQLSARRLSGAIWLLFLGGLFFLHQNHILRLTQSWPLFIVAGGLGMLFGRSRLRRTRSPLTTPETTATTSGEAHE
jgi:hypothetical protein